MKIITSLLIVLAIVAFTVPTADLKLQYQFKKGDQYLWTQDTKQTIKQTVMTMEQNTENVYQSEFLVKVAEVTATGARLEATYTKLKNMSKSPMGENSMDSHGAADKIENKIFQSILNRPFFVIITKSGNVEKIENADNLWGGFKDLEIDDEKKRVIQESLEMMLGEGALKSNFQSAFIPYPDKKVKQGEKWTVSHNVVANFAMAIENTWSVVSFSSAEANLYADGVFSTTDKEKTFNLPGGLKAKSDLSGKQAVKSTINPKTGWPSKQEHLVELKGTMTLLAGGMIPQDMEVPMEILSETTSTITRK